MKPAILNNAFWTVVGAGLAAGAIYGHAHWAQQRAKESPEAMVMDMVRRSLNDPESARFENVTFNAKTKFGCGVVNAKNRMGGYVGFARFVVYQPDGSVQFEPKGQESHQSTAERLEAVQKQISFLEHAKAACDNEQ